MEIHNLQQNNQCNNGNNNGNNSCKKQKINVDNDSTEIDIPTQNLDFNSQQVSLLTKDPNLDKNESKSQHWGNLICLDKIDENCEDKLNVVSIELKGDKIYKIGRNKNLDLFIPLGIVSSLHCTIYKKDNDVFIIDNKSSNGTFINDNANKIESNTPIAIKNGDIIYIAGNLLNKGKSVRILFQDNSSTNTSSAINPSQSTQQNSIEHIENIDCTNTNFSPSSSSILSLNDYLKKKCSIQKEIGRGAFAVVYKGVLLETRKPVALKVIEKRQFGLHNMDRWKEQLNEINILKTLSGHPNIISYHDHYLSENENTLLIITELVTGGELYDHLINNGAYPEDKAIKLIKNIISAIVFMHDHDIIHRDIKPENIILKSNEKFCTECKLIDFGISKNECSGRKTFCGSISYIAPEIFSRKNTIKGIGRYTKSVDIWSLGVCVYIILSCIPPFNESDDIFMYNTIDEVLTFKQPEWTNITSQSKEFIKKCLKVSEQERITANQALHDPLFDTIPKASLLLLNSTPSKKRTLST